MLLLFIAIFFLIVIVIPVMFVLALQGDEEQQAGHIQQTTSSSQTEMVIDPKEIENQITVPVYRTQKKKVEQIPIEVYVEGVVAAEMPADFEPEALKAQALAARTYIIRRLAEKDFSDVPAGGVVTDTVQHQVFLDDAQRREKWGRDYQWKTQKIREAVVSTKGQVITYNGKPINATFFSTSNGYTENSEEYWQQSIPYLRSVEVPWDKESPLYQQVTTLSLETFRKKLGVPLTVEAATGSAWSQVLDWSTGRRIARIKVGDQVFTGREIREKLDLPSSHFSWKIENGMVIITTLGYGHGVGMSQWGANGMAREGKTVDEIISYFYQGVQIEDYHQWVKQVAHIPNPAKNYAKN